TTGNQNVGFISSAIRSCAYSTEPRIIKNPTTASLKRGTGGRSSFNGIVCTIFGCSGFVGRNLPIRLGKIGTQASECDPYHIRELKVGGDLGQVYYVPFDLRDEDSIIRAMKYSNVVVNLIGTNYETSNFSFNDVHVEGARTLARLAKKCNVERFVHMSCLNAAAKPTPMIIKKGSKFLKSKWFGELAVKEEFPEATIVRPSVIYGCMDNFISHYMARQRATFEYIPLWHKGEKSEKQPVYIHDVISGLIEIIRNPDTAEKTYQFVGPERYTLSKLVMWMYDLKLQSTENPYKINDMKYNPYFWFKTAVYELMYSVHPAINILWEVMELHHTTDKIDPSLPTLEDLGVTPTNMKTRLAWEIETYRDVYIDDLEKATPPNVKSVPD
ncbi:NADH dehydrogenase [ubiquinone] 1 alpha subcomplex subunit 9, mitochondrial, partial [Melipona quadrifasciata]